MPCVPTATSVGFAAKYSENGRKTAAMSCDWRARSACDYLINAARVDDAPYTASSGALHAFQRRNDDGMVQPPSYFLLEQERGMLVSRR